MFTEFDLDINPTTWPHVTFVCYQREISPTTGKEHLQGYVHLDQARNLQWCKNHLSESAHFEIRRGSHDDAVAYCSKVETRKPGESPVFFGQPPVNQGKRNDIKALKEAVDSGIAELELWDTHFSSMLRYYKAVSQYRILRDPPRSNPCYSYCFWGPSGTGKSHMATILASKLSNEPPFWLPAPNSSTGALWWDGYTGQKVVIIDEFYGWIPHPTCLRICDRYDLTVQTKGGSRRLLAEHVIFTSNKSPTEWWPRSGLGAMERRLKGPVGICMFLQNVVPVENREYVIDQLLARDKATWPGPLQNPIFTD